MRAVVQRVISANVSVEGQMVSNIGRGLCILIGLSKDDQQKDVDFMVRAQSRNAVIACEISFIFCR